MIRLLKSLNHDRRGAALVEFAIVVGPMLLLIAGTIELSFYAYTRAALEGAVRDAARIAITGNSTSAEIDGRMNDIMDAFPLEVMTTNIRSYPGFEDVRRMENVTVDENGNGRVDQSGECWIDVNDDGVWNDVGQTGLGGGRNVLLYEVEARYPVLMPLADTFIGTDGMITIRANTAVRNEPFPLAPSLPDPEQVCLS